MKLMGLKSGVVGVACAMVVGMAASPAWGQTAAGSGCLIGLTSSPWPSPGPAEIYTVDPSTGQATLVTTVNGESSLVGLSFLDGIRYGSDLINYPGSPGGFNVGSINTDSGVITFVSDQDGNSNWQALASNESTGLLYAGVSNGILALDPRTGTIELVASGLPSRTRGLAYDDANGILYAVVARGSDPVELYTINPTDSTSQFVGFLGIDEFRLGLAYDKRTQTLFLNVGEPLHALYTVNVNTGAATLVGPNGITGRGIDGLAWLSEVDGCPWDCEAVPDGNVGINDFLAVLAGWGLPGPCDFGGGGVGINDFLKILANWGPCP